MSRAAIPSNKKNDFINAWRQVCAYSFPRKALAEFSSHKKTPIEFIEDLEILRFLELGHKVRMLKMSDKSISVDHKLDISKVEKIINKEIE